MLSIMCGIKHISNNVFLVAYLDTYINGHSVLKLEPPQGPKIVRQFSNPRCTRRRGSCMMCIPAILKDFVKSFNSLTIEGSKMFSNIVL